MNKPSRLILLLLIFLAGFNGFGQVNDAGLWISGNVEKKLTRSLALTFSEELRMNENISEAGTVFSDLGVEYKFTKQLRISAHYRFLNERRLDDSYKTRNRYYIDLGYRFKLSSLAVNIRERLQSETTFRYLEEGVDPAYYSRTKVTLKLDTKKKYSPYLYSELFHPFNDPQSGFADKIRYCAGIEYQFTTRQMIDLNYLIQVKSGSKSGNDFVIGLGYFLTL